MRKIFIWQGLDERIPDTYGNGESSLCRTILEDTATLITKFVLLVYIPFGHFLLILLIKTAVLLSSTFLEDSW